MANNSNVKNFLDEPAYPPIRPGEYDVTIGEVTRGVVTKNDEDIPTLTLQLIFANGRVTPVTFFGADNTPGKSKGILIVYNQLREQTNDDNVYASHFAFFKNLEGKNLKCWISQGNSYVDANGRTRHPYNYSFINKVKATVEEGDDDEDVALII